MLQLQNNCCAICNKPAQETLKNLYVDHNHKNGKIRGLLCQNCNSGLGHFKEDIVTLKNAINYLNQHGELTC